MCIDEVPMVLFELHENASYYIDQEEYEKGLTLLQKAQHIIEVRLCDQSKQRLNQSRRTDISLW